jgi:hypothetical protein
LQLFPAGDEQPHPSSHRWSQQPHTSPTVGVSSRTPLPPLRPAAAHLSHRWSQQPHPSSHCWSQQPHTSPTVAASRPFRYFGEFQCRYFNTAIPMPLFQCSYSNAAVSMPLI